jgi:hypothetical protein
MIEIENSISLLFLPQSESGWRRKADKKESQGVKWREFMKMMGGVVKKECRSLPVDIIIAHSLCFINQLCERGEESEEEIHKSSLHPKKLDLLQFSFELI